MEKENLLTSWTKAFSISFHYFIPTCREKVQIWGSYFEHDACVVFLCGQSAYLPL